MPDDNPYRETSADKWAWRIFSAVGVVAVIVLLLLFSPEIEMIRTLFAFASMLGWLKGTALVIIVAAIVWLVWRWFSDTSPSDSV
jgi:preprotein translocase subunit SecF